MTIIAVGKTREADAAWSAEYLKRLKGEVTVKEITAPKNLSSPETQKTEAEKILKLVPPKAFVIALDERGKDMPSRDFATKLKGWQEQGREIIFIIGGADGLTDDLRARADFMLGFGKLTWPHRMVRVMLLEQIYRAQQINAGHPYHRD